MSRSAKVEELAKLFEDGALTREEYTEALRRVDLEEAEQKAALQAEDSLPSGEEPAPEAPPRKPYQTNRSGSWVYQDRSFPELDEPDPNENLRRYIKYGGLALGVIFVLFIGPTICG